MKYYEKDGYILVRKHWIITLFNYSKFFFFLWISFLLVYIALRFQESLWYELVTFVIFPVVFVFINYAFLKLILENIRYFNDLLILKENSVIVIKTSLIDTDNVEIIDLDKITKIDTTMTWIIPNLLAYWDLVLEQFKDRTRIFHHIYKPYRLANLIKEAKSSYEKEKNSLK